MTINREQIKQVFLAHGFTVKPGQDDLKEYVYAAAEALIAQAQAAPEAEPVEVVAHMYQHDETGRVGFVDQQQVDWGFEKNNPRLYLCGELMTVAQHERIVAAITAPPATADAVSVPRELLESLLERYDSHALVRSTMSRVEELRALLARQEVKS